MQFVDYAYSWWPMNGHVRSDNCEIHSSFLICIVRDSCMVRFIVRELCIQSVDHEWITRKLTSCEIYSSCLIYIVCDSHMVYNG